MSSPKDPQTIAVANGIAADKVFGAVAPPICLSSTFAFAGFEKARGYDTRARPIRAATCWPTRSRSWKAARARW